jgi:hypothetical protein
LEQLPQKQFKFQDIPDPSEILMGSVDLYTNNLAQTLLKYFNREPYVEPRQSFVCSGQPVQNYSTTRRRKKHYFVGEVETRPEKRKVFGNLWVDYKGRKVIVRNSEQQRKAFNSTTMGFQDSEESHYVKVAQLNTQISEVDRLPPLYLRSPDTAQRPRTRNDFY